MRLIDADELKECFRWSEVCRLSISEINKIIDNAPTVPLPDFKEGYKQAIIDGKTNFSRPQGEWIKVKEKRMSVDMSGEIVTQYKCSKCGRVIATFPSKLADYYPLCNYCGADMQKGGAENG